MKLLRYIWLTLPICLAASCSGSSESPDQTQLGQAPAAPAANPNPAAAPKPITPPVARSGSASPEAVVVYFKEGEATLDSSAQPLIDYTARLFREGNPFVMTVAGYTDATGPDYNNLILSARRADAVKQALIARGIPPERLQMQALGKSDPAVQTAADTSEPQNRRVRVTWR
jgi:outer membrane protein OmpA-like peptidoglycan-associated protein